MIVPSIDLMNGHAVQLVGGKRMELDASDPRRIARCLTLAGEMVVVDLDAALGRGGNADTIRDLLRIGPCRVGGGIRSVQAAIDWLDAGAVKVVLGTAATPEVLAELPRERVIAALDAVDGEVVVNGWRDRTGQRVLERMHALREFVTGFLVTFVEHEGRLGGAKMDAVAELVAAAGDARVTIAGGISTVEEIAALDGLGADAQVGMALYKNHIALSEAIAAPLISDRPDGLWPTVVVDASGVALGLAYSSPASLRRAVESRQGVYHSRRRGVWVKGETSGATQELLRIDADCDRDCLRFTVRQQDPGFCHERTRTCWGEDRGIAALARRLRQRADDAAAGSYTQRLLNEPELLRAKLIEEAGELADAREPDHVSEEAADVIYFALAALARAGGSLAAVEAELDRRAMRVTRRPGHAKPAPKPQP
jgi:phosphoribosyl-ATP pyrophosphohydrolase